VIAPAETPRATTERSVIGCMLIDSKAIDTFISRGGERSWFVDGESRRVADCILNRYESGQVTWDMIATSEETGVPLDWFAGCTDLVPTIGHMGHYADALKGHVTLDKLRGMVQQATTIVRTASSGGAEGATAALESLFNLALAQGSATNPSLSQGGHTWLDKMTAHDEETTLLDWPCRAITDAIGRINDEVIWVIALPSVGKTAFVVQWLQVLAQARHRTALASLESRLESIASRFISHTAPMNTEDIRQRKATPEQIATARQAADDLSDLIAVNDNSMTLDQVYAWGRSEARKGAKLLIVDNTRHVQVPGNDSRSDNMAAISARMAQLKKDTGLPVVVLHHSKLDQNGKEGISWSADIEKDADMVLFLREIEDKCEDPSPTHRAGLWCIAADFAKNREGKKKVRVLMEYDKEVQCFRHWIDEPYTPEAEQFTAPQPSAPQPAQDAPMWADG